MKIEQKGELKEEPIELVRLVKINDWNRGPHQELPAKMYFAQLDLFEMMYNIKLNGGK
jgi:hypothetical protein